MGSYLDGRTGLSEELQAEIAEKRAAKPTPEQAEAQAEKESRVNALIAEQALVDAGDPDAIARRDAQRAERDAEYAKRAEEQKMEEARDRSPFADY